MDASGSTSNHDVLNFTHRTAHGGDGDTEGSSGVHAKLAREQLARLQKMYPEVFAEPVYPVDRTGCKTNIKH